ncbi:MAG: hypothetical protein HOD60_06470 [Candidatus Nitrosopelagicus sp.]|jgi:hypothetical protein|nr:hypothetical protein [Candidatus Nitrosopelagicus sp.]
MIHFVTVKSLLFENSLIISLSKDWLNYFSKIPEFDVMINDKDRLCITSQEKVTQCKELN